MRQFNLLFIKMKERLMLTSLLVLILALYGSAKTRDYYQIQVYKLSGKVQEERMDNFLKNAYIPAMHRAGIKTIGVFKPIESDTTSGKRIYVWQPFTSLDHFVKTLAKLENDALYQKEGEDVLGAPFDKVPYLRKESILLRSFHLNPNYFVPTFKTAPSQRIYELRSYEGPTENLFRKKVEMFNEGGEMALFKSLEFNAAFYAEVISGSTMPNLMYMTTFSDMESHDAHWSAFTKSPEWLKLKVMPQYLNTVSKAVKILLHPTDYSDL